jgi:ABC-type lipoprotein release transport system permease subunit
MNSIRLAWRNLARHKWRTGLTVGGVAVAVALLVWMTAMLDAYSATMVDAVTEVQVGDIKIQDRRFLETPALQYAVNASDEDKNKILAVDGVERTTRRLMGFGLIGHEKRSQVALVLGVEPDGEPAISKNVREGKWLSGKKYVEGQPREVVLGRIFARQLKVKVGDELVLLTNGADGSSMDDMLKVVGIAASGSSAFDRQAAWMDLKGVGWLLNLEGKAHEMVIHLKPNQDLEIARTAIMGVMGSTKDTGPASVQTWREIMPDLANMIGMMDGSMGVIYFILYFLAGLGILNAQRMSAQERTREFGIMLAIGQTPKHLGSMLVVETVLLTTLGGLVGALMGGAISLHHTINGFQLVAGEGSMEFMGISIDNLFYFNFTWPMVIPPVLVVMVVGAICGIWPAIASSRLDSVRAISGRT